MKDLVRESEYSRETIHFYISSGLVPPGKKTSRTTAEYTQEHLEKLLWIKRLRKDRALPLKALKALSSQASDDQLSSQHRIFLRRAETAARAAFSSESDVTLASVMRPPLTQRDVDVLADNDLIEIKRVGRRRMVSREDGEIVEVLACLREVGFTRERGYSGAEIAVFDRAMEDLVASEAETAFGRLEGLPPAHLRDIIERSNPYLEHLMVVMRRKKLRLVAGNVDRDEPGG